MEVYFLFVLEKEMVIVFMLKQFENIWGIEIGKRTASVKLRRFNRLGLEFQNI